MTTFGLDLGGTKCAVVRAGRSGAPEARLTCLTAGPVETLARLEKMIAQLQPGRAPRFGIACGGPLDSQAGLILSPPNLPGWDRVPIVKWVEQRFGGRAFLMNDANAGALAEWFYGAGRGLRNLVFCTCGTGFGAGLICDGRLYEGANGNAGEIGHVRLTDDGPVGHGKAGSVEGWCSGGGLARLLADLRRQGNEAAPPARDARELCAAAASGDRRAVELLARAGRRLGRALAVLVDVLNPEAIILGSLYVRARRFLEKPMREELKREAFPEALAACRILPAALGDRIGDYAALAAAEYGRGGPVPRRPEARRPKQGGRASRRRER